MNAYKDNPEQTAWIEVLKSSPKVQELLSPYSENSHEAFFDAYARFKNLSLKHGAYYLKYNEEKQTEDISRAMEHLEAIQQKKLFDLQCLWRADQIEIPDASNSWFFKMWKNRILDCPVIEPINRDDISRYILFLGSLKELPTQYGEDWQNYTAYKENYYDDDEGSELPQWYEFHNMVTGNGIYLTYPDTRGERESRYIKIKHEYDRQGRPPYEPKVDEDAHKPYLPLWKNEVYLDVAEMVEDKKTLRRMEAYHLGTENFGTWEHERAMEDFEYLSEVKGERIAIPAHRDYREALHLAAQRHQIGRLVEHLPAAFSKYKFMRETGIALHQPKEHDLFNFFQERIADLDKLIAEGKTLSGDED